MSREKEFAKNTLILFLGTFFTKIVQYFLFPIYTGYLSTSEYGTVELFNTIVSLVIPIIGLQIEQAVFRYLIDNRKREEKKSELLSTSFIFVVLSSIITILIALIVLLFINNKYKWLVLIYLIINYFSSYLMQVSRGLGKNSVYSFSGFISSFVTIIFNIIFLVGIGLKIDGMLYGSIIGFMIGNLYLFFRLKMYSYLSINKVNYKSLKQMLKYSLPMIPNSLSWWIFSSSDRIIISAFIGLDATGLLSVAYKFSNIIVIIYNVFNMSLTESISLHIDDKDISDYFSNIFTKVGNAFTSCGALLISCMPIAFKILINRSFNGAYNLIPIAIIASLFQVYASALGVIYIAKSDTKSVALTSIIAAIINILVDLILVNYIGIYAAIVSTIISYLVLFVYRIYDANKRYFKIKIFASFIINIIITGIINCTLYYTNCIYLTLLNMIIAIVIAIMYNKFVIGFLIRKITKLKQ